MKKFVITMYVEVADHDIDVMKTLPAALMDRLNGTAIHITGIQVIKDDSS